MFRFHFIQQEGVEDEESAKDPHCPSRHNGSDLGGDTPDSLLCRVDVDDGGQ